MMNNLFTHCGAQRMTREEVEELPLPVAMGSRHIIRPLTQDVDLIEEEVNKLGLQIIDSGYAVKFQESSKYFRNPDAALPKQAQVFGIFEIGRTKSLMSPYEGTKDFSIMVGLRGSYDQSLPRGIAVGSRVFVCDNLAFSGQIHMHTKQTLNIDTRVKEFIRQAIQELPNFIELQDKTFNNFKDYSITHDRGENIIIDMFRQEKLSSRGLVEVLKEWDNPSFFHGEDSIWSLFNAITQTYKNDEKLVINNIWDNSIETTQYLTNYIETH